MQQQRKALLRLAAGYALLGHSLSRLHITLDFGSALPFGDGKVICALEVEPKLSSRAEVPRQPHCSIRGDRSGFVVAQNVADPGRRHARTACRRHLRSDAVSS